MRCARVRDSDGRLAAVGSGTQGGHSERAGLADVVARRKGADSEALLALQELGT